MPKQLGNPYEELEDKGTVAAIEETGGTAKIQGPTDAGASSQVSLLRSITQQKPDAIVLAANDPNAIAVNSPYSVGRRTDAPRSTSFSCRRRYSTRSATVTIFRPCCSQ